MKPIPYVEGTPEQLNDIIAPYLTLDGAHFARDFYMVDRVGAMAGASVAEYFTWTFNLGVHGMFSQIPAHNYVLKPDSENDAGVITSPGSPDCVDANGDLWNPLGASYMYQPFLKNLNFTLWIRAGCPKHNDFGDWANQGVPQAYVDETWKHPLERDLYQPGFPLAGKPRYAGKK